MQKRVLFDIEILQNDSHLLLSFPQPKQVVGSAVYNGGFATVNHILNIKVPENRGTDTSSDFPSPADTLRDYYQTLGIQGSWCGMLTAASMDSFRLSFREYEKEYVVCFLTAGLSNARRAGDPAEVQHFSSPVAKIGTVNMIIGTSLSLSPSAMMEAGMVAVEAKTCVFQDLCIQSRISDGIATGTGTDSMVIFIGSGTRVQFCGKHTLAGEMIASTVYNALKKSLEWYQHEKQT